MQHHIGGILFIYLFISRIQDATAQTAKQQGTQ